MKAAANENYGYSNYRFIKVLTVSGNRTRVAGAQQITCRPSGVCLPAKQNGAAKFKLQTWQILGKNASHLIIFLLLHNKLSMPKILKTMKMESNAKKYFLLG